MLRLSVELHLLTSVRYDPFAFTQKLEEVTVAIC